VHRGRSRTPCASLRCVIIRSDCPVYPLRKASRQLSSRGASPTRSRKRAFPHGFPRPPGASQSPEPLVLRARTQLNQRSTLLHNFHVFEPHSRESKRESQKSGRILHLSPPPGSFVHPCKQHHRKHTPGQQRTVRRRGRHRTTEPDEQHAHRGRQQERIPVHRTQSARGGGQGSQYHLGHFAQSGPARERERPGPHREALKRCRRGSEVTSC